MQESKGEILVIDDDRDVLMVLQMALNQSGYKTLMACGTGEAQEMLRLFPFDLVLCDMTMPGENGLDFRERMEEIHPNLPPFIFCSGMAHEFPEKDLPAGVAGFLSKPFSLTTLLNAVEKALKDHENFQILRAQNFPDTNQISF